MSKLIGDVLVDKLDVSPVNFLLTYVTIFGIVGSVVTWNLCLATGKLFISKGLAGVDLLKENKTLM